MPELTSDRLAQEFPGNERLVAEIYRKYREDSGSVDRQWAQIFARLEASAPAAAAEAEPKAAAKTEPKTAARAEPKASAKVTEPKASTKVTEPKASTKVTEPKAATAPARGAQPKETSVSTGPKPKKTPPPSTDAASGATAPKAAAAESAGSGAKAAAKYGASVMKKIRKTKKQRAPATGTVVVGFVIGEDGGLSSVKILQSSSSAELDQVALDHIWRAAPFPPPPAGADRKFSFEFVGKG